MQSSLSLSLSPASSATTISRSHHSFPLSTGTNPLNLRFCGFRRESLGLGFSTSLNRNLHQLLRRQYSAVVSAARSDNGSTYGSSFDYDSLITGAGVGGHGVALHAVEKVSSAGYDKQGIADYANNLASKFRSNLTNSLVTGVDILTGFGIDDTNDTNEDKTNVTNLERSNELTANKDYSHLWVQCEDCYGLNYKRFLKEKMNICEHCGYHLKMNSSDRIELLIDPGTWNPIDEYMVSLDPIEFHSEEDPYRLDPYQQKTGLLEAVQTGTGQLHGIPVAIGIMEFEFMGGSMGSVVGEKITRLIEYATNQRLPLIIVCASGGARMQEGSLSLMQMAKISSALHEYQTNQKLFYVPILTSPTTGGVTASFGMLGDICIVEPDATIAFAGKRVIEQTLNLEVPEGSQSAEFLFEKGLFDSMVPRNLLKEVLSELFQFHGFFPLTPNEKGEDTYEAENVV
ncbi:acetyl-CoA carboxylase carboxyltransferase beta subunit [Trifolium pratense]|uniref:Acetyl-CoA carboxylase carboxyltransferase beta subunit n=1 Tax=Trifolium pratense TaxID=57577 RepID=A0A2K3MW32_TRIPR|nr:acetyl-CoA carboxylase carboxyltransferase beta subunit [Trifolium pratense]